MDRHIASSFDPSNNAVASVAQDLCLPVPNIGRHGAGVINGNGLAYFVNEGLFVANQLCSVVSVGNLSILNPRTMTVQSGASRTFPAAMPMAMFPLAMTNAGAGRVILCSVTYGMMTNAQVCYE